MDITSYTKMPQCVKCGDFQPGYQYVTNVTDMIDGFAVVSMAGGAEALKLTCRRCDYSWLMLCIPEEELS